MIKVILTTTPVFLSSVFNVTQGVCLKGILMKILLFLCMLISAISCHFVDELLLTARLFATQCLAVHIIDFVMCGTVVLQYI